MRLCRTVGGKHLHCNVTACAILHCLFLAWDWDCLCFSFDRNYITLEKRWEQLLHAQAVPGCLLQLQQIAISTSLEEHVSFGSCLLHMSFSVGNFRVWGRGWCFRGFLWEPSTLTPQAKICDTSLLCLFCSSPTVPLTLLLLPGTPCFCQPNSGWALLGPGSDQEECSSYKLVGVFWFCFSFLFFFFEGRGFCFCFSKLGESLTWSAAQPIDLSA